MGFDNLSALLSCLHSQVLENSLTRVLSSTLTASQYWQASNLSATILFSTPTHLLHAHLHMQASTKVYVRTHVKDGSSAFANPLEVFARTTVGNFSLWADSIVVAGLTYYGAGAFQSVLESDCPNKLPRIFQVSSVSCSGEMLGQGQGRRGMGRGRGRRAERGREREM